MTQNIIALSGKLQSGKTTATNFLFGLEMLSLNLVDTFKINEYGKLVVPTEFQNESSKEIRMEVFDPINVNPNTYEYLSLNLWPTVKQYNFADTLKRDVCINILGLTYEQCYGSDEEKNSPTKLKWEDMPGVVTENLSEMMEIVNGTLKSKEVRGRLGKYYDVLGKTVYHTPGYMTGRDVMQFVGTEVFRRMYGDVWVDTLIRQIKSEGTKLALIGDCRFPNEVKGIQDAGGKVIRLTRGQNQQSKHESEVALDQDRFDWKNFDAVLDNENMSIDEQNNALYSILDEMNVLPYKLDLKK